MKNLWAFIVFLILTLTVASLNLPPFPSVGDLPYQAHSFNDVGYIRQLLRRGVKYFKHDVSLSNKESCIKNSDWNQSAKCYKTNQYAEEYCCLAMRGDTSGMFNFDYPFSTLKNYIDMLEEHINQMGIQDILFVAINFQFGFQFDNQLVQNAIYRMAKLMQKYSKLYFGFGMDDFILQYDRVCRKYMNKHFESNHQVSGQLQQIKDPLQSLNEQSCTEKRKFISSSRFFLQSGAYDPSDPRDYYGRYRNFNVFYKQIIHYCENGFPLWVKKHPQFPLIFWEPSDERQIQLVIQTFLSDTCRKHHRRDINGIAITSNIDPEVFQFYLKSLNQSSSSNPLIFYPNNQKVTLAQRNNFLSKMTFNNSEFLILGQQGDINVQERKGSNLQILILQQSVDSQKVQQLRRKQLGTANGTIKIVGGNNSLLVVQQSLENSEQRIVQMILLDGNLQILQKTDIDKYIDVCFFDGQYYILRQTQNPTIFNVLKTNDFNKTSIVLSFSLVLERAKSIESFLVAQDSEGKIRYFLTGSVNASVWIGQIRNDNIYKSSILSFGQNSKLTLKSNGMIAVTIQNGRCNSGVQINNGDVPLCHFHKFYEWKPMISTRGTITLIQVTLSNLIQYLQKQSNQPVTPCTQKFIHSKVFNGRKVHLADVWSRLFFVSEYVHISQQAMLNSLFCAPSNFQKLKNNKKGLLGTIWSRGNVGNYSNQIISQNQQIIISEE